MNKHSVKKNMLRGLCILQLFLLLTMTAGSVLSETAPVQEGTVFHNRWTLSDSGVLSIEGNDYIRFNARKDVPWRDYIPQITSVYIGDGIPSIGEYCFEDAEQLRTVRLPEGLTWISLDAFSGCVSLEEIHFPDSLERLDYWAFSGCSSLRFLTLGSRLEEIPNYAFQACTGLETVVVLEPITRLGYDCLENCSSLRELYLPNGLQIIDQNALRYCFSLTDIYFAGSQDEWSAVQIAKGNEDTMAQVNLHFEQVYSSGNP